MRFKWPVYRDERNGRRLRLEPSRHPSNADAASRRYRCLANAGPVRITAVTFATSRQRAVAIVHPREQRIAADRPRFARSTVLILD
jgi:hypothetical protein